MKRTILLVWLQAFFQASAQMPTRGIYSNVTLLYLTLKKNSKTGGAGCGAGCFPCFVRGSIWESNCQKAAITAWTVKELEQSKSQRWQLTFIFLSQLRLLAALVILVLAAHGLRATCGRTTHAHGLSATAFAAAFGLVQQKIKARNIRACENHQHQDKPSGGDRIFWFAILCKKLHSNFVRSCIPNTNDWKTQGHTSHLWASSCRAACPPLKSCPHRPCRLRTYTT